MLEQRRAKENGYITLKEAAALSHYTPDYVGQLIRSGKIRGVQVYNGVAWMTTEEEVQAYLNDKTRSITKDESLDLNNLVAKTRFSMRSYVTLFFVILFGMAILGMQYAIYNALVEGDISLESLLVDEGSNFDSG